MAKFAKPTDLVQGLRFTNDAHPGEIFTLGKVQRRYFGSSPAMAGPMQKADGTYYSQMHYNAASLKAAGFMLAPVVLAQAFPFEMSKDYEKNERNSRNKGAADICAICGRALNEATAKSIQLHNGGAEVVTAQRAAELNADPKVGPGADCGVHLIGPECAKKIPAHFLL